MEVVKINVLNENLTALKDKLPPKWGPTLKKQTNYSLNTIYKVLDGKMENISIIKAAVELAESYAKEKSELATKIKSLK